MFKSNIANKLIYSFWADCIRLYEKDIGTFEDIDKVCRSGFGNPKGPFEMMDETGLDTIVNNLELLHAKTGDKRFCVPELLNKMIDEKKIGRKSGSGFYNYAQGNLQKPERENLYSKKTSVDIRRVGVVGFGSMGKGIVQVIAEYGYEVTVKEMNKEILGEGIAFIEKILSVKQEKGKITADDKKKTMARIKGATDIKELKESDIVIEAVFEKMDLKKEIFSGLDRIINKEAILATNTSCLSVTEISSATNRAEKVCGLHFFNPVPVMKLVEVIKTEKTSEETFKKVTDFAISLGKEAVKSDDSPGFIANRILCPYIYLAIKSYANNEATKEEIDESIRLAAGFPMGPFALMDLIGLDVCLDIGNAMFKATGDEDLAPPALLKEMAKKGWLGRKTGRGFYDYA